MIPSLIVIEGPDGAGKSALARRLIKRMGAVGVHHGDYRQLRGHQLAAVYRDTMLPALSGVAPVVLDRAWHSEPIYASVFRGGANRLGTAWPRMLERLRLSAPSLLICVRATFDQTWDVVSARASEELAQRREQHERVWAAYERASWLAEAMWIDRQLGLTPDEEADLVLSDDVGCRYDTARFATARDHGVIGNVNQSELCALLVGEQAPDASRSPHPFVSFSLGGCSHWLTSLLETAGVGERRLLWMNAVTPDGHDADVKTVVDELRPAVVIALGRTAEAVMRDQGVPGPVVPHPQYMKRFFYNDDPLDYPLVGIIKSALDVEEVPA